MDALRFAMGFGGPRSLAHRGAPDRSRQSQLERSRLAGGQRDYALVGVGLFCGLRVSEQRILRGTWRASDDRVRLEGSRTARRHCHRGGHLLVVRAGLQVEGLGLSVKPDRSRCIYCGTTEQLTADHVPPKNIFPEPRTSDLITVPACERCNKSYELDDEYFRAAITVAAEENLVALDLWRARSSVARSGGAHLSNQSC